MITAAANLASALFGDAAPATDVDLATALDLLRNERRRLTMREVTALDLGETVTVRDLAHEVAAIEQDTHPDALPWTASKSAYVALLDTHLPKLAAANVVVVDEDVHGKRTVARGPALDAFVEYLDDGEDYFVTGDAEC